MSVRRAQPDQGHRGKIRTCWSSALPGSGVIIAGDHAHRSRTLKTALALPRLSENDIILTVRLLDRRGANFAPDEHEQLLALISLDDNDLWRSSPDAPTISRAATAWSKRCVRHASIISRIFRPYRFRFHPYPTLSTQ